MKVFFSISGFWTMIMIVSLFSAILYMLTKSYRIYTHISPNIVILAVCLIVLRGMLPIEIGGAKAINIPGILTLLDMFLLYSFFTIGTYKIPIWFVLLQVWLGVAFFWICKLIWEYRKVSKQLNSFENLNNQSLEIIKKVEKEMCVHGRIAYKISQDADSPFIFGLFRVIVVLPRYFNDFTEDEMRVILKHELNHYKKRDGIMKMTLDIFYLVFWWLPFRKCLVNKLDEAIEMRTDINVVNDMSEEEKTQYLKTLYYIAEKILQKRNKKIPNSKFFSGYAGLFETRFRLIVGNNIKRKTGFSVMLCFLLFLFSYIWVVEPLYEPNDGSLSCEESCTVVIQENGMYQIYFDDEYLGDFKDISFLESDDFNNKEIIFQGEKENY